MPEILKKLKVTNPYGTNIIPFQMTFPKCSLSELDNNAFPHSLCEEAFDEDNVLSVSVFVGVVNEGIILGSVADSAVNDLWYPIFLNNTYWWVYKDHVDDTIDISTPFISLSSEKEDILTYAEIENYDLKESIPGFFVTERNKFNKIVPYLTAFLRYSENKYGYKVSYKKNNDFDLWRLERQKSKLNNVFFRFSFGKDRKKFPSIVVNDMNNTEMILLQQVPEKKASKEVEDSYNEGVDVEYNSIVCSYVSRLERVTSEQWSLWNILYNLLYFLGKEYYKMSNMVQLVEQKDEKGKVIETIGGPLFDYFDEIYNSISVLKSYNSIKDMKEDLSKQNAFTDIGKPVSK